MRTSAPSRRRLLAFMPALACLALLVHLPSPARAGAARLGRIIVSSQKNAARTEHRFSPQTPIIRVSAVLIDVPPGARVSAHWIAESTGTLAPNFLMATTDIAIKDRANLARFELSKPTGGWPAGRYRVDLLINGKALGSAGFQVLSS